MSKQVAGSARSCPPGGGRPTMKDVASRAGVALKTVSRVVNGEPGVTPETAKRVHGAIEDLGFRRNESARLLRTGQTATLGFIADTGPTRTTRPSTAGSRASPGSTATCCTPARPTATRQREEQLALAMCARRVDGLIIIPTPGLARLPGVGDRGRAWPPCSCCARRNSVARRRGAARRARRRAGGGRAPDRARAPADRAGQRRARPATGRRQLLRRVRRGDDGGRAAGRSGLDGARRRRRCRARRSPRCSAPTRRRPGRRCGPTGRAGPAGGRRVRRLRARRPALTARHRAQLRPGADRADGRRTADPPAGGRAGTAPPGAGAGAG